MMIGVIHSRCSSVEQKLNIPEGFLKKETKTQEQKKKDLEEVTNIIQLFYVTSHRVILLVSKFGQNHGNCIHPCKIWANQHCH